MSPSGLTGEERRILERIQDRLLWLATHTIHYANTCRKNPSPERVGGHQSSSTSVLTLLTALYFKILRPGDRIAVKPTAAPIFYAIQVLRGLLPPEGLKTYRSLGGLQAYPSRAKNPDWFDFSTGSMGLGAVAPAFAALLDRYLGDHFGGPGDAVPGSPPAATRARNIALVGDAELDEGSAWEAWTEEAMADLAGHVVVVDLNRQSLDRVVGDRRSRQIEALFRALGWHAIPLRFGRRLAALFAGPGGAWLASRFAGMDNGEYHALLRLSPRAAREAVMTGAPPDARGARRRCGWRGPEPPWGPRRSRSRRDRRGVRRGRRGPGPAGGHPGVDAQGLAAPVRRGPLEPRSAGDGRSAPGAAA